MPSRPILAFTFSIAVIGAAVLTADDNDMIRRCQNALADRLFGGGAHGDSFVTAQEIKRDGERVWIRLQLASGEGRSVSGTCVFRDGKLFDVK